MTCRFGWDGKKWERWGGWGWMMAMGLVLGACSPSAGGPPDGGEATAGGETTADAAVTEMANEPAPPRTGSLKVVSYNVHGLPSSITKDDTNARLKAIGPKLNVFVIAGLQEVFTQDGHRNLEAGVKHTSRHWFSKAKEGKAYGAGLLLLANLPVVSTQTSYYEFCNGTLDGASDCLASKGFQMVRYEVAPGLEIDVYNSHFEAGSGDKDLEARRKNLLALRDAMLSWSKDRPIVFTGDTNLKQTRPSDAAALKDWIAKVGLVDSCEAVNCPEKGRIDRVMFRDGLGIKWQAKSWSIPLEEYKDSKGIALSDHDPIVVELSWTENR